MYLRRKAQMGKGWEKKFIILICYTVKQKKAFQNKRRQIIYRAYIAFFWNIVDIYA